VLKRQTYSQSSLPLSETQGIEVPFSKIGLFSHASEGPHGILFHFIFQSCLSDQCSIGGPSCIGVGFFLRSLSCIERSELFIIKATLPVPRMDNICSPGGEAVCSHQGASGHHRCHRGPHCRAWGLRPTEYLAARHLRSDHGETSHNSGDF
jgi:hypothetical protein